MKFLKFSRRLVSIFGAAAILMTIEATACHRPAGTPPRQTGDASPTPGPSTRLAGTSSRPPEFAVQAVETREGTALWYNVPDQSLAARRAWTNEMTAASDQLPQNTYVRVTRLGGGGQHEESAAPGSKPVVVRITDNGVHRRGVLIDVDQEAAQALGMVKAGEVQVRVEVLRLKNATSEKPVDPKAGAGVSKASDLTDKPVSGEKEEKAAAKAKDPGA